MKPEATGARPAREELYAAARLLGYTAEPIHASKAIEFDLKKLDYHGIALLALAIGELKPHLSKPLQQRKAMMVANEELKKRALQELSDACEREQLQPLLFKGSALAYLVYPQPWLRPRTDSDLFIDVKSRDRLANLLKALGYQKLFAIEGDLVSYQATYSKALTNKVALNIDLHWRINNRQILAQTFDHAELCARSQPLTEIGFRTVSNVDHLLIACLHRLGHHQREERLAWLYDMHLLGEKLSALEWRQVAELAEQKQLAALVLDGLRLCQEIFRTNVPTELFSKLESYAGKTEPSSIFLSRDQAEWRITLHELRALPSFAQRWQWLSETLLPNADYVRQQMGTESLAKAHFVRLSRGLRRIFRTGS